MTSLSVLSMEVKYRAIHSSCSSVIWCSFVRNDRYCAESIIGGEVFRSVSKSKIEHFPGALMTFQSTMPAESCAFPMSFVLANT